MENNIDKIFREKLGDVPDFDPAAWDRMDQLLQEDRRNRKLGYWKPILFLGLLGLLVGVGVICLQSDEEIAGVLLSDDFAVIAELENQQTSVTSIEVVPREQGNNLSTTDAINTKGQENATNSPSAHKDATINETEESNPIPSDLHTNRDAMSSSHVNQYNDNDRKVRSENKTLDVRNQTERTTSLAVSSEVPSKSTSATSQRLQNASKGNVSEPSITQDQITTGSPINVTQRTNWKGKTTIAKESLDPTSTLKTPQTAIPRETALNDGLPAGKKDLDVSESAVESSDARAPIFTLPLSAEVAGLVYRAPVALPSIQIIHNRDWTVSLSTMVGYGNGTISTAGFLVQQDINRLWSAGAGLAAGYRSFGYANDLMVRDKRYSFGSTLSERTLSISGVVFGEIPIYLQRRMGRFDIRIGLSPSYQALTRGTESRAGEILLPAEWYDVDDVRSVQVNYQLGVGYRLYRRLSVTAELGYRSSIFKPGSVDYSDGGIVTSIRLSYDIFKL